MKPLSKIYLSRDEKKPKSGLLRMKLFSSLLLSFLFSFSAFAQTTITGKVTSPSGLGLAGASVDVKGSTNGTSTDGSGNYSINAPATGTLVFSYVGYASQTIAIAGRTSINITLVTNTTLDEAVVVIGYGTQRKIDNTGSVASVSGNDIAKQPNNNPISSLQGKVAGVTIVNGGAAGSSPTVRIRGVNSTGNGNPLYVVDGIFQTSIDYLNPGDIESIDILKDPSSIAIFGLQGGNGVIVVTTKRAKKGQTRVNFQTQAGYSVVQNKIKVTGADDFKRLYTQQNLNDNVAAFDFTNYTANTDWQDLVLRKAFFNNNSLSISNTGEKTTTLFNLGYNTEEGVVGDDKFEKFVARFNQEVRINSNLRVGGELTGFYYNRDGANVSVISALRAIPNSPVQSPDGIFYSLPSVQRGQILNPLNSLDRLHNTAISKGYRAVGNVFAELKFAKNFTFKSTFYTDLAFNGSRGYSPLASRFINLGEGLIKTDTVRDATQRTTTSQSESNFRKFQQDHILTWSKKINNDHDVTALAGFTTLYNDNNFINGNRRDTTLNIPNDPSYYYIGIVDPSNPGNFDGGGGEESFLAYLARINYSYKNRYLFNASFRREGNSKYSPTNRYQNYGSVGAGWVISKEAFFDNVKFLDYLKVRGSYGTVGNGLGINSGTFLAGVNTSGVGVFGPYIYPGIAPAYIPDPNLKAEVVTGTDLGLEFRTLKNRLNGELTFYNRTTDDIITRIALPNSSFQQLTNAGSITNKGIELALGWRDRIGSDFTYSISGNGSYNKNKVKSIGSDINFNLVGNGGSNLTRTGESIGFFYGYRQVGIYQSTADLVKQPALSNSLPGDIAYEDTDGDGKITPADRVYLGTPFPIYNFGGDLNLGYKGFDASVAVNGVAGNKIYVQRKTPSNFAQFNYEVNRLNAYTGPGTSNIEPILSNQRGNNSLFSSYYLEKGDYFRIRNVQLGYTFNKNNFNKIGIESLRVYLSGQNVATFSYATGYTPEVGISNPIAGGIDNGSYPVPSNYSLGVNVIF